MAKKLKEKGTMEKNDIAGKKLIEDKKKLGERRRRGMKVGSDGITKKRNQRNGMRGKFES
jgi:hypothetical protein